MDVIRTLPIPKQLRKPLTICLRPLINRSLSWSHQSIVTTNCHWTITKYHGHPSIYFFWYTYSIVSYHILLTDIIIVIRFDI